MISKILKLIFGSRNDRELKRMGKVVKKINALADEVKALSDEELAGKTAEFKQRLADGATLDQILPEAFAVVREAGERVLGMRHFDVQLIGGMALHEGKIAEMRTGEGKTLVATLPAYLNALTGNGVHLITVNDYLANRDAHWMGPLYEFLGMSVGVIRSGQLPDQKREAYAPISSTAPTTSSASTTCATIWPSPWRIACRVNWPLPSSTRWTPS